MANPYFQFKQFIIKQDRCGMKVCTDSCILGAYPPPPGSRHILDIGCGTGLLSLMLAQKLTEAGIDAVEIDEDAAAQAAENIKNSPWADRIKVYPTAIQQFSVPYLYDLIICNPPFYAEHLPSARIPRRQAFHQDKLSFQDLLQSILRLLAPDGKCRLILPQKQANDFIKLAIESGLFLREEVLIFDHPNSKKPRSILTFDLSVPDSVFKDVIYIKEENGAYSTEFTEVLKPFYLFL